MTRPHGTVFRTMTPSLLNLGIGNEWAWARALAEAALAVALVWLLWRRFRSRSRAASAPAAASAADPLARDGFWSDTDGARADAAKSDGHVHAAARPTLGTTWQWNAEDDTLLVPDLFLELVGISPADQAHDGRPFTGAWLQDLILPEDRRKVRRRVRDCLWGRTSDCAFECRIRGAGERTLYLQIQGVPRRDRKGRVLALVGSFVDVTRQVEVAEERDRLFNLSRDLLAIGDFEGYLKQVNPSWVRILGWSRDELMSRPMGEFIHPEDRERVGAVGEKLLEGRPLDELQLRFRCRNGSYRWLSWSSYPYPGRRLVFSAVRDITAQKEAEAQLLEYQGRLRSLTAQLARVEDLQRRELAAAIHDGLAQQLFGIRAQVSLLNHPAMAGKAAELVPEILKLLDDTMQEARTLSFSLLPPVLSEVGLEVALEWFAGNFTKRTGIACTVDGPQDDDHLPQEMRAMIFQCVRELLTNVHKHSRASAVAVTLRLTARELVAAVGDDGVGFNPDRRTAADDGGPEGFGLFSIRERMRAAGGTFGLETAPGRGCTVTLTLPLPASPAGEPTSDEPMPA